MELTQIQKANLCRLEKKYPGTIRVELITREEAILSVCGDGRWEAGDGAIEELTYTVEYGQLPRPNKYEIDYGELSRPLNARLFDRSLYEFAHLKAKEVICAVRRGHLRAVGRRRERITERNIKEAKKAREAGVKNQVQLSLIMS